MEKNPKEILIKELVKKKVKNQAGLNQAKREIAKKFRIPTPSNVVLLKAYHKLLKEKEIKESKTIETLLRKRPIRSLSGIVNVSVLTKPYPCPGKCVFCPTEKGMPKSYLAGEPAADRAKALNFDPYLQTQKRIEMLRAQGHPTDKIELRIVGGTWSYYPRRYQIWFVKKCFQACNEFGSYEMSNVKCQMSKLQLKSQNLKEQQKLNEKAKCRIVGISTETRPDFVTKEELLRLRKLGVTMVELGVQSMFDDVLEKCQTGLTTERIAQATKLLKDAGFKVLYQMMPNLPGSNLQRDLKTFQILFEDERFKPDWLKIYPCVVCENTVLYNWWKKGKYKNLSLRERTLNSSLRLEYKPYSDKELINLLIKIKKGLPYWIRVTRIFRDIPSQKIMAGSKISNLREVVKKEMEKRGLACHCIRCREIKEKYHPKEKIYLFRENFEASGGQEIFLSFENKGRTKLYSLLRLRIPSFALQASEDKPSQKYFIPILKGSAIIRELHTYGPQVPIKNYGDRISTISPQHRGLGKKLIKEAEKVTKKEFGLSKIAVISGIGVRDYFQKLGFKLKNTYMIKKF